jgi:hypothetical protein
MSFQFWRRWLIVVTGAVIVYGFGLMLFSAAMQNLFVALFFPTMIPADLAGEAVGDYLHLVHGVLGAVIVGWMITLLALLITAFNEGQRSTWIILALSIGAWFVIDSGFSLLIGVPAHALFNVGFLILFVIPLAATYRPRETTASIPQNSA